MVAVRHSRLIAACCAFWLCTGALAGSWEIEPSVQAGLSYDDNPALEPDSQLQGEDRATTYLLAFAEAEISKSEPSSVITFSPRIRRYEYPDSEYSRLNRTDYLLRGSVSQIDQLFSSSLSFLYEQQTVLSTADFDADFGDSGDGGGDFADPDEQRDRWTLAPAFNWSPTEKDSVILSGSVGDTTYSGVENSFRADTESSSVSFQYQRAIAPRHSVGLLATFSDSESVSRNFFPLCFDGSVPDFDFSQGDDEYCPGPGPDLAVDVPTNNTTDNEIVSYSITWSYRFSERTRLNLNIGEQETTSATIGASNTGTEIFNIDNSFDGRNNSLNLVTSGERWNFELRGSRGSTVQDDGFPSENLEIRGKYTFRLTPKLTLLLETSASERESRNTVRRDEVLFYRADVGLTWRVNEKLSVVGTFIRRNRDPEVTALNPNQQDLIRPEENEERESDAFITSVRYEF